MLDFADLVPNEDLDMTVKILAKPSALAIQIEPKVFERLKWKDKRVKVQISLTAGQKRLRLVSVGSSGWEVVDKKAKGLEISVRQLAVDKKCIRRCAASIENEALIIKLPNDYEPKNSAMIVAAPQQGRG
jgi:hypothetical protein